MSMLARFRKLFALMLLTVSNAAFSGTFTVSSVNIVMQARQPTYSLTVKNESQTEALTIQADSFSWNQVAGKDVYEATKDIIMSPRVFSLPAGGSQVVRLALRNRRALDQELAYRLFVREVVDEKPVDQAGVRVALQLNIPVQVLPEKQLLKPVSLELVKGATGQQELLLLNSSNVRLRLTEVELVNKSTGVSLESFPKATTVLANTSKAFGLPELSSMRPGATVTLHLKGQGDGVVIDQTVDVLIK